MKYEVKSLPKSTIKITIEISPEELKRHKEKAAEDISREVKISGFRSGHTPLHILEQYVDKKHILAHAIELATQYSYAEAVTKEKLRVVSRPKIKFVSDTTKDDESLKFEAEVAVLPEVKLKGHKEIKIPKEEVKVTQKEVDEVIEDLKAHFTDWKDVDRAIKKGDRAEVDFEGFEPPTKDEAKDEAKNKAGAGTGDKAGAGTGDKAGAGTGDKAGALKPIPNTASKNHPIVVGENIMVPGFEDNLIGLKKGEKKKFTLTFPKEYHKKDFQNKKVLFEVEIKKIEEGKKPELNEELIEKLTGQKMSVDEFKKDVERNIEAQKTQKSTIDRENKYLEELVKRAEIEIPEALVEEEIDFIIQDMQQDLAQKGIPFEKFLEQTKMELPKLRERYREEAERRIKIRMALTHAIDEEKIEITDKELEEEIAKMIKYYPKDQPMEDNEKFKLKNRLLLKKFFDKVLPQ